MLNLVVKNILNDVITDKIYLFINIQIIVKMKMKQKKIMKLNQLKQFKHILELKP